MIVMKAHIKVLYPVFGARTYGSLALILILHGNGFLSLFEDTSLLKTYLILMFPYPGIAVSVNLLGYLYNKWI